MTFDEDTACHSITATAAGGAVFEAGVTVSIQTGQALISHTDGYFQFDGTPSSPVTIEPYTPGSAWYMQLQPCSNHKFDFLELDGYDMATLTDEDNSYDFTFNKHPQNEDPVVRPPILDIDDPLGRGVSRVHHKGNSAAIVELSGNWRISDGQQKLVNAMKNDALLVCYISNKVQLGQTYIVLHEYVEKRGHPVVPYTIAMQEAR